MAHTPRSQREEYEAAFPDGSGSESKRAKALAIALEVRKFEIELYWKRASYFWVFTGAALAGHLAALGSKDSEYRPQAMLLTSCVGLVFAFAWFLVNRASKFWQSNWEAHVDLLEDQVNGPIYKTVLSDRLRWWHVTDAYKFSVSKINQLLSFYVVLIFSLLVANTVLSCCEVSAHPQLFPTGCLVFTGVGLALLAFLGTTGKDDRSVSRKLRSTNVTDDE